jgi:transposase InsO family protein
VPSKLILFGEEHLRRTLSKFVHHYHEQRQHQGIGNKLIAPNAAQRVAR